MLAKNPEAPRDPDAGLVNAAALGRTYLVSQTFASWNQIGHVLRRLEAFRSAAGSAYGAIHISKGP